MAQVLLVGVHGCSFSAVQPALPGTYQALMMLEELRAYVALQAGMQPLTCSSRCYAWLIQQRASTSFG